MFHTFAICAYQDSPYLEACIRSLKAQTVPVDIILTTSTPSPFIEGMAQKYGIPLYVREGMSSIQEDWNFAFRMAKGMFVTIAHQDDMYARTYAAELKKAFNQYHDMTVFTTDYVTVKDGRMAGRDLMWLVKKMLRLPLRFRKLCNLSTVKNSALVFGNPICCPSCTYRSATFGGAVFCSGYRFALDWHAMMRAAEKPGRMVCFEKPLIYHRLHKEAASNACTHDNTREQEETAMFREFWPEPMVRFLMRFYKLAYRAYD